MPKSIDNIDNNPDYRTAAANLFKPRGKVLEIIKYGHGNVNDTFLVTVDSRVEKHFILQRINMRVFPRPELVMLNLRTISTHIRGKHPDSIIGSQRRWETPYVLPTPDGEDYWIDDSGSFWRALSFIERAESFDTILDMDHAEEVGYALGLFQRLVSDLPVNRLADTLEGFHITPLYLAHYDEVLARRGPIQSPEAARAFELVNRRRASARILEEAKANGKLHLLPIHGDPKVNNIMMDTNTRKTVGMIDLDTVKPGLIHYDIGDCLRSCCNPMGEETDRWEDVRFDLDICRAVLKGYLESASSFLSEDDYAYLFEAVRLIAFELGLRFFTDYLEGNIYFKSRYEEHNLARALVQFTLAESIESQESSIRAVIRDMR
jgi:hypothetical protein